MPAVPASGSGVKVYLEQLVYSGNFRIDTSLSSYTDALGWHDRSHTFPDIAVGEYHVNHDGYLDVARTMVHEAAHHLLSSGELDAETFAEGCVP